MSDEKENTEENSTSSEKQSGSNKQKPKGNMIALKDWRVYQPKSIDVKIKTGDDVSKKVPAKFIPGLISEGVIKGELK